MTKQAEINQALESLFDNPTNVEIDDDGRVYCDVDPMPNTNEAGRIFAGMDYELLQEVL